MVCGLPPLRLGMPAGSVAVIVTSLALPIALIPLLVFLTRLLF
jgi:hypothetical protein